MFSLKFLVIILGATSTTLAISSDNVTVSSIFPADFMEITFRPIETRSTKCFEDFDFFLKSLNNQEIWAQKIFESWGTRPSVYAYKGGPNTYFGNYDACLSYEFQTRLNRSIASMYALTNTELNKRTIYWGACFPETCTRDKAGDLAEKIVPKFGLNFHSILSTQKLSDYKIWTSFQTIVVVILSIKLALVLLSTLYEIFGSGSRSSLLTSFSLCRNANMLMTARESGQLGCFDGAKVLAMIGVILHHALRHQYEQRYLYNPLANPEIRRSQLFFFCNYARFSVDIFLFISGFLIAWLFLVSQQKGLPFNLSQYYIRRLVRMLPVFLVKHLIHHAFMGYIKSPLQKSMSRIGFTTFTDWLSSFIDSDWYVKTDLMLYFLSPLVLFPLKRYGYKFFPIVLLLIFCSVKYFLMIDPNDFTFNTRCNPWLFGLAVAYIVHQENGTHKRISPIISAITWPAVLVCIYRHTQMNKYDQSLEYTIFRKFISPLVISWASYVLLTGHSIKLAKFLSHPVFQFLGKLTYSAYVMHRLVLMALLLDQRVAVYASKLQVFNGLMGMLLITVSVAYVSTLLFELPYINLHREVTKIGFSKRIASFWILVKEVVLYLKRGIYRTSYQNIV